MSIFRKILSAKGFKYHRLSMIRNSRLRATPCHLTFRPAAPFPVERFRAVPRSHRLRLRAGSARSSARKQRRREEVSRCRS